MSIARASCFDTHFHLDIIHQRHKGITTLADCYSMDPGCKDAMLGKCYIEGETLFPTGA